MQDEGDPEGVPDRGNAGDEQDQHGDTDWNQQYVYPGAPGNDQKSRQYAPKKPGDDQCDSQGSAHLLPV